MGAKILNDYLDRSKSIEKLFLFSNKFSELGLKMIGIGACHLIKRKMKSSIDSQEQDELINIEEESLEIIHKMYNDNELQELNKEKMADKSIRKSIIYIEMVKKNPGIKYLIINNKNLYNKGMQNLLKEMEGRVSELVEFDIRGNHITSQTVSLLVNVLQNNSKLQILNLCIIRSCKSLKN